MRILLVTNYFAPDSGAAAVRLTRLAGYLQGFGHEVTVLTSLPHYPQGHIHPDYAGRWVVVEDRGGIRVIQTWLYVTSSPRISRRLWSQLSFMFSGALRGLAIPRHDVVLIEAQPVFTALLGAFLAFKSRTPYVLNISDLWPDHLLSVGALRENSPTYHLTQSLVNQLYHRAKRIIAMSPAWANRIEKKLGSRQKIEVICNGVDLTRFHPQQDTRAFREKYKLGDAKLVTFIGTFATQYDFATMFNALDALRDVPGVVFAWIGTGSQHTEVEKFLAQAPHLRHIPWLDHDEIPAAWNASYLTYWAMRDHALYRGTIPAKLYETLACGTPVIAATRGITAAILRKSQAGRSVRPGDAAGLAAHIRLLLKDEKLRQTYSQNARRYAETHFNPEDVARAYERALTF